MLLSPLYVEDVSSTLWHLELHQVLLSTPVLDMNLLSQYSPCILVPAVVNLCEVPLHHLFINTNYMLGYHSPFLEEVGLADSDILGMAFIF